MTGFIKTISLASLLTASSLLFAAEATVTDDTQLPAAVLGGVTSVSATVEAVDKELRAVTLKTADGDTLTITAGPEVRNFDQIDVGDTVTAEYFEALAMTLEKGGSGIQERVEQISGDRAAPGDKPAGSVTRTVDAVGTVRQVDREARLVFVEGAQGMVTLNIPESIDLDTIEVGDEIHARYIETVAISVTED